LRGRKEWSSSRLQQKLRANKREIRFSR
jgi:hypothetical protein